jgi:hypothetical protein
MERYNFSIQNTTTNSKTEIKGAEVQTIIQILKGFDTKDKNNIGDAEKTVAKTKKTKKVYNPASNPNDNNIIKIT